MNGVEVLLIQPAGSQAAAFKIGNTVIRLPTGLCQRGIAVSLNIAYDMAEGTVSLALKEATAVAFSGTGAPDELFHTFVHRKEVVAVDYIAGHIVTYRAL